MANTAILYDASKCMGCRGCQVACKEWNDLKGEKTTNRGTIENPYAVPRAVEFRDSLPLTVTEKIFKRQLREEEIAKQKKEQG